MSEAEYYAALGLKQPDEGTPDEVPTRQEAVDPARNAAENTEPSENENEQEAVDPAIETGSDAPEDPAPQKMSREERARQARERRRRETPQAVDAALQRERAAVKEAHEKEMAEVFAAAGMIDRLNGGKKITNKQEFDAWMQASKAEKLSKDLQAGRLTPEGLQEIIEQNPVIREAKAAQEAAKQETAAEKAAEEQARMQETVRRELEEIHAMDPSVSTLDDILKLPTGEKFRELVQRGNLSFLEAFRLANFERLQSLQAAQARQGNKAQQGKDHLRGVNPSAAGGAEISDREFKTYKMMCPWMTDDEIRADFAKRSKGQKG